MCIRDSGNANPQTRLEVEAEELVLTVGQMRPCYKGAHEQEASEGKDKSCQKEASSSSADVIRLIVRAVVAAGFDIGCFHATEQATHWM